ncbi:hypothetical protein JL193_08235 [Polaribacter batillariae]|uniref:Redoxin domain-containing protein n=1 Tax=Polaribacter batillariae TaxID=2808900 RepID=A0ABX7T1W0_9FLAO|nr:hypothetical protein [Polaribacter batillariae]QTD39211.1 hypothetical protein JL193_08235 [Polaribacter batillariae]
MKSLEFIVNNTLNKELIIPDSLFEYNPFPKQIIDSNRVNNSQYKIYTHINASCGACINKINIWNKLSREFKRYNTQFFLVLESDDDFELFKYYCQTNEIEKYIYPFFLDKKKDFIRLNPFMVKSDDFKTVLTDKNNKILVMGDPTRSNEMKDIYIKEIVKKRDN